jgi:hypothetical protein
MTETEIRLYLSKVSDRLSENGMTGEIVLFGGAAMVLAHQARVSTKDVDAVFAPKSEVYRAADAVALEYGLDAGWLNDAVKGFLSEKGETAPVLDYPNLKVYVAVPEYLLAMKCMSMRLGKDETDLNDIRFLIGRLGLKTADDVLNLVERYYPGNRIQPKTRFAVEELCQHLEVP